ncbi:hypothetical protein EMN47_04020 [Prolixibacteraceae bacterium JC049]|nr:hypothetical protein [Prolixibacteraceae bacterium JC049]
MELNLKTKKMKHLKYILILSCIYMVACTDMDDTYQEFITDGPIVYLSNADELQGFEGRERVAISWANINDPRVDYAEVTWNSGKEKQRFDIAYGKADTIFVDNLIASKYAFNIRLCSEKGFSSLKKEVLLQVYDDVYESYLVNREIENQSYANNALKINFVEATPDLICSEFIWTDNDNNEQKSNVSSDQSSCTLENLIEGTAITMRTLFKPSENCIDTFYSAPKKIYVGGEKININVSKSSTSEAQSGYGIEKSHDKDLSSYYHSRWGAGTKLPVTLEYFLENTPRLDIIEYTPRDNSQHGNAGNFRTFELWAICKGDSEYKKVGDYDFEGRGITSELQLEEPLINPESIKFIVKTVNPKSNGLPAVNCAEMHFIRRPQWWLDLNQ